MNKAGRQAERTFVPPAELALAIDVANAIAAYMQHSKEPVTEMTILGALELVRERLTETLLEKHPGIWKP